jgi:hypothetical protein
MSKQKIFCFTKKRFKRKTSNFQKNPRHPPRKRFAERCRAAWWKQTPSTHINRTSPLLPSLSSASVRSGHPRECKLPVCKFPFQTQCLFFFQMVPDSQMQLLALLASDTLYVIEAEDFKRKCYVSVGKKEVGGLFISKRKSFAGGRFVKMVTG